MLDYESIDREIWTLTEEGAQVAKQGSHEARVFEAIPAGEEGMPISELQVKRRRTREKENDKMNQRSKRLNGTISVCLG